MRKLFVDSEGNYSVVQDGGDIRITIPRAEEIEIDEAIFKVAKKHDKKFDRSQRKFVEKPSNSVESPDQIPPRREP